MPKSAAILFRSAALAGLLALAACARRRAEQSRGNGQQPDRQRRRPGPDQRARGPDPGRSQPRPAGPSEQRPPARDPGPGAISGRRRRRERRRRRRRRRPGGQAGRRPAAAPATPSACGVPFVYGNEWANRLPAEFPAYPGGRVTEAAGSDRGDCHMRVVTFTTADPYNRVLEHYRSLADRAGFSAEQQARGGDQVLGGTRGEAAYYLIVTPDPGRLGRRPDRQQRPAAHATLPTRVPVPLGESGRARLPATSAAMPNLLIVMLGGALGAGARHLVGGARAGAVRPGLSLGDADRQPRRRPADGAARRLAGAGRRQRGDAACSSRSACSAASPPSPPSASRPS